MNFYIISDGKWNVAIRDIDGQCRKLYYKYNWIVSSKIVLIIVSFTVYIIYLKHCGLFTNYEDNELRFQY